MFSPQPENLLAQGSSPPLPLPPPPQLTTTLASQRTDLDELLEGGSQSSVLPLPLPLPLSNVAATTLTPTATTTPTPTTTTTTTTHADDDADIDHGTASQHDEYAHVNDITFEFDPSPQTQMIPGFANPSMARPKTRALTMVGEKVLPARPRGHTKGTVVADIVNDETGIITPGTIYLAGVDDSNRNMSRDGKAVFEVVIDALVRRVPRRPDDFASAMLVEWPRADVTQLLADLGNLEVLTFRARQQYERPMPRPGERHGEFLVAEGPNATRFWLRDLKPKRGGTGQRFYHANVGFEYGKGPACVGDMLFKVTEVANGGRTLTTFIHQNGSAGFRFVDALPPFVDTSTATTATTTTTVAAGNAGRQAANDTELFITLPRYLLAVVCSEDRTTFAWARNNFARLREGGAETTRRQMEFLWVYATACALTSVPVSTATPQQVAERYNAFGAEVPLQLHAIINYLFEQIGSQCSFYLRNVLHANWTPFIGGRAAIQDSADRWLVLPFPRCPVPIEGNVVINQMTVPISGMRIPAPSGASANNLPTLYQLEGRISTEGIASMLYRAIDIIRILKPADLAKRLFPADVQGQYPLFACFACALLTKWLLEPDNPVGTSSSSSTSSTSSTTSTTSTSSAVTTTTATATAMNIDNKPALTTTKKGTEYDTLVKSVSQLLANL